jgi:hypothetical protein
VINADTSVAIYFGPKAPKGKQSYGVQTWPDKGWTVILRLYGPLQPLFDKTNGCENPLIAHRTFATVGH